MKIKSTLSILFLSYLVSALAILGIAFVICPDTYISGFWYRVLWTEILNILFWYGCSGWFKQSLEQNRFALVPVNSMLTFVYCAISLILVFSFYQTEKLNGLNDWHMILQIVIFAIYGLLLLRLQLAGHFADKDLVIQPDADISPLDLAHRIKIRESDYPKNVCVALKQLREKIAYSLQNTNKIRTNPEYKELVKSINDKLDKRKMTTDIVKQLNSQVEIIQHQTKRQ